MHGVVAHGVLRGLLSCPLSPQDAIVIHEVYEEGAAARDGRLWAGDQILEVSMSLCMCMYLSHVDLHSVRHSFLMGKTGIVCRIGTQSSFSIAENTLTHLLFPGISL